MERRSQRAAGKLSRDIRMRPVESLIDDGGAKNVTGDIETVKKGIRCAGFIASVGTMTEPPAVTECRAGL